MTAKSRRERLTVEVEPEVKAALTQWAFGSQASLIVFLALYFPFLWFCWLVWMTEPKPPRALPRSHWGGRPSIQDNSDLPQGLSVRAAA
jgi:hypothetical protein